MIGDGSGLRITHTGSASLPSCSKALSLKDVLYVPEIHKNLISVYRLCNANKVSVEFFPAHFQVKDLRTGVQLLQGRTKAELYEWPIHNPSPASYVTSTSTKPTLQEWHSRLGHPSLRILKTIVSQFSLPFSHSQINSLCRDCSINKSHKLPFSETSIRSSRPLEILFSDVWTSPIMSIDNYKYYLIIVDHHTRYTWFYPLKLKSHVKETFIKFKALVENRFQTKIGTLFSDNGGEYIALREFLSTNGITHLTTPPHTPEHNGLSERRHRHIVETGLSLLTHASIPTTYWSYALSTAVYLINRMPSPTISLQSPYQKLFQTNPNYSKLKTFGCLCYPWLRPYNSTKLEPKSSPCVFIGYSLTQSAYFCLQPQTQRIYVSRHVRFDETIFPFSSTPSMSDIVSTSQTHRPTNSHVPTVYVPLVQSPPPSPLESPPLFDPSPFDSPANPTETAAASMDSSGPSSPSAQHSFNAEAQSATQAQQVSNVSNSAQNQSVSAHIDDTNETQSVTQNTNSSSSADTASTPSSQHATQVPVVLPAPAVSPPRHPMTTRSQSGIVKPNVKYTLAATLAASDLEPRTVTQALKDDRWRNSMSEEFNAQIANQTWNLVPSPPPTVNVIGCKWIFRTKFNPDGSVHRYKSRLVAKGYSQQAGLDYNETFSPVIKSTTIRLVLDIAVKRDWPIRQLDVNNAFQQGTLTEDVYMSQPPGYIDKDRPNHVCHLKKALYGLKQAPRAWYMELRNFLQSVGFKNSVADTSLFILKKGNSYVYMLIYVDDILVTGSDSGLIQETLTALANRFSVKDHEELSYFLGIEAKRVSSGLHLSQRRYILDLLERQNMLHAKPIATPMATVPKLTLHSGTKLPDATEYRRVVGSLQYLAFTRPDISYAVNRLSQFMHSPSTDHWQAVKRVLRYLAGTPTHGIFIHRNTPLTLHAFSDSDWAGDSDDLVSTNAYVVYLGRNPISWSSKKQKGVARSSTEAEYRAVANTSSELSWISSLMTELGVAISTPPVIYCDNIGATYLCANPVFHSRMKHIALDYHFIRNQVQVGHLRVKHISTKDQLADALTKPLNRTTFQLLANKIGVSKTPPS